MGQIAVSKFIKKVVEEAADNFSKNLSAYHPAENGNGFHEKNLSWQIAKSFSEQPKADLQVFMEVPFKHFEKKKIDNHFDTFIFNRKFAFLVECKRLHSKSQWDSIKNDFERLRNKDHLRQIFKDKEGDSKSRFFSGEFKAPKKIYGLVMIEYWRKISTKLSEAEMEKDIDLWWKGIRKSERKNENEWERVGFPRNWQFRTRSLPKIVGSDYELYWLYAYGEIFR